MRYKTALLSVALFLAVHPALAQRLDQMPTLSPLGSSVPQVAAAQSVLANGIAVIVNEAVISISDVKGRIDLALLSAGLPNRPDVRQNISVQVVRSLINEQLQLQEGEKAGLSVSDEEVDTAFARLAEDNKIPGGDMAAFLRQNKIDPSVLRGQVKSTLVWNKYVMRSLRPRVEIGDDEVNDIVERMRANAGQQEFLVSEIFLPVEKAEEEDEVKAMAEKLTGQLKNGAVFGAVARQFSQSAGAASGGDMGWIQSGQMESELDKLLQTLQAGEIAGPVRTASGYHILGLREKRTIAVGDPSAMTVKLKQAFHPYPADGYKEDLLREANTIRQTVTSCEELGSLAQQYSGWRTQDLGTVKLAEAPSWLAEKVANITEGHASDAMATDKGALMLFVCERSVPENINIEAIRASIGSERLELLARRQIRDMRRDSFIDIRLKDVP